MKTVILCLLINSVIYAQTTKELMLNNDWYLVEMNVNGETILPPTNEEMGIITMGIEPENESMYWFHTEVCSSYMSGFITWNADNQFSFWDFAGGFECLNTENQYFEFLYASFYGVGGENGAPMNCSIEENQNGVLTLTIQNQFGNQTIYSNDILLIQNNNNLKLKLYPNPVKDKLTIENPDFKIISIKVRNASGKLVLSESISTKQTDINFSSIPSGVYFITFEENGKLLKTEKLIKN